MRVKMALCQIRPSDDPDLNAEKIANLVVSDNSDVFVFPESFLTGYGNPPELRTDKVDGCVSSLSQLCRRYDKAVAVGTAMETDAGFVNTLAFLSPDGDSFYDKIHLAKFGIYSENGYAAGRKPAMGSYHGIRFGLGICYDAFFPELYHWYSLRHTAVNICASAVARPSAPHFEKILPARALENVTYTAFVNNVGTVGGLEMAGGTRMIDPLGNTVGSCPPEGECVLHCEADTAELEEARNIRRHLADFRRDIDWSGESF